MPKNLSNSAGRGTRKNEMNLTKLAQIIKRRKYVLTGVIIAALAAAFLYNTFTPPQYEASVLLKKEKSEKTDNRDEIAKIISLQTQDEIETEMELVKTWEVVDKVVKDLDLYFTVNKIVPQGGGTIETNADVPDYEHKYLQGSFAGSFPKFDNIEMLASKQPFEGYIKRTRSGLEVYNNSNILVNKIDSTAAGVHLSSARFNIDWSNGEPGSKVYFTVKDYNNTVKELKNAVTVEQKAKTDVFQISVRNKSPYMASLIANSLTDNFRESRIEQQKQTIRYSFTFVDKNLQEIQGKLQEAENNLSQYKSSHNIMDLDGSSQDLVRFISNLEAEKMQTQLELTQYQNKQTQMEAELKRKGYFDQTFLTPQGNDPTNSPFSEAMKQLSDLELKRLQLLEKQTESHPEVSAIDKQIKELRSKLSTYNENTLTSYNIIKNSLEKKLSQLEGMSGKYESKMRTLPGQENMLANLTRERNVFAQMYTMLLDKREEMRMAELSKLQDIVIVDPAKIPIDPVAPRKAFNMAAALIFGIVLGFIAVFIVEVKYKKLVSLDDFEEEFDFPIFAIIPNYPKELKNKIKHSENFENRFVTLMPEQDGYKESFRVLRTKLSTSIPGEKKIFMVTSCEENTGKTSIVANMAVSLAQSNKKVIVVDCDLRKGTLSKVFDISKDTPGLITYLSNKADNPFIYSKIFKNLYILPSGGVAENSSELLTSDRVMELYEMLNNSIYDYVIFDTPPLTRVVDTLVLGKVIKDALIIMRPNHTFKESVNWGLQELEQANINVIGSVVNAGEIEKSSFRYRYGYGYGYKYGYKEENEGPKTKSTSNGKRKTEKVEIV